MTTAGHESPAGDEEPDEQIVWVTLYSEQVAEVAVRAAPGTPTARLQQLALEGLDDSGGAEWFTRAGWVEHVAWSETQRLSDAELRGERGNLNVSPDALTRALSVDPGWTLAAQRPTEQRTGTPDRQDPLK